jgi:putative ABC transport system permease protein
MDTWRRVWRTHTSAPLGAATIVVVLALGIGANATLFSILDAVWLRAIPYPDAERLVLIFRASPGSERRSPVWADIERWQQRSSFAFADFTFFTNGRNVALESGNTTALVNSRMVDAGFFQLLGEPALAGRVFDRVTPSSGGEIVVSERLWRARLGAHPTPEALTVKINGQPATVIGVVSDRIRSVQAADVFLPLTPPQGAERQWMNVTGLGKLRRGLEPQDAEQSLIDDQRDGAPEIVPLRDFVVGANVGRVLTALWGLTVLVVLVAGANVSALLLSGIHRRRAEMAIRTSLGASRAALYRQVLSESAMLVALGCVLALAIAYSVLGSVVAMMPPLRGAETIAINWRVVAIEAALSAVLCLVISVIPVLSLSELRPAGAIVSALSTGQGWSLPGLRRLLAVLVGGEVVVATAAVVITAVILGSFVRLIAVDPGFEPSNVVTAEVTTLRDGPLMGRETQAIESQALDTIRALPGVAAAGSTDQLPLGGSNARYSIAVHGAPERARHEVYYRRVSSGYLEAMRIPIKSGRAFTADDVSGSPRVVLINERTASEVFPGENPIDQRLVIGGGPPATIVGVVGDVRASGLDRDPVAEVYGCRSQDPSGGASFVVRFHDEAPRHAGGGWPAGAALDDLIRVHAFRTLDEWVSRSVAEPRFRAQLCGVFGLLVLLLVTVGVGASTMQAVVQRRRELGVRLALGASTSRLRREMLWSSMMPVLIGIATGLVITAAAGRAVSRVTFLAATVDVWSVAATVALVACTAAAAAVIAARAIVGIDPVATLRSN